MCEAHIVMLSSAGILTAVAVVLLVVSRTVSPGAINGAIGLGLCAVVCFGFWIVDRD